MRFAWQSTVRVQSSEPGLGYVARGLDLAWGGLQLSPCSFTTGGLAPSCPCLGFRIEWADCSKDREWPAATIYPEACDDGDVGRHVLCHEFMLGDPYCQPVNRRS